MKMLMKSCCHYIWRPLFPPPGGIAICHVCWLVLSFVNIQPLGTGCRPAGVPQSSLCIVLTGILVEIAPC